MLPALEAQEDLRLFKVLVAAGQRSLADGEQGEALRDLQERASRGRVPRAAKVTRGVLAAMRIEVVEE